MITESGMFADERLHYNSMNSTIKPNIFELRQIGAGILCIMPCPRSDSLAQDLGHYMQLGINKIVSLLENKEAIKLGVALEDRLCQELGIEFQSFPIPDRKIPAQLNKFENLVEQLYAELQQGKNITVHCFAGIGRTGVLAGRLLMRDGMSPQDAIELMSQIRGRNMPQSQEQYEFLTGEHYPDQDSGNRRPVAAFHWLRRLVSNG